MKVLFLGLNYAPEKIGIAVYATGLCEELVARGHEVRAVVGKPYYPEWQVYEGFRTGGSAMAEENGVRVRRVPLYVPADPSGAKRVLHYISFALSCLVPMLREARAMRPDIVVTEAPSLIAAPVAMLAAKITGAKSWLHVQDFEVEAAFATGLVDSGGLVARTARAFERFVLRHFDQVSTISYEMCRKAEAMIGGGRAVIESRNWANIDDVKPLDRPSSYRELWAISTPHVALYSGSIANKQGIEILVEVARQLAHRKDLTFVICGQGPNRDNLEALASGLDNIQFHDLQPIPQLGELLGLATIHLLPQKASAADLLLPSKLTNMLASGRPVVATAHAGTGLAREVDGCGLVVEPDQPDLMAGAILRLMETPGEYQTYAAAARERALTDWNMQVIIDALAADFKQLAVQPGRQPLQTSNAA